MWGRDTTRPPTFLLMPTNLKLITFLGTKVEQKPPFYHTSSKAFLSHIFELNDIPEQSGNILHFPRKRLLEWESRKWLLGRAVFNVYISLWQTQLRVFWSFKKFYAMSVLSQLKNVLTWQTSRRNNILFTSVSNSPFVNTKIWRFFYIMQQHFVCRRIFLFITSFHL